MRLLTEIILAANMHNCLQALDLNDGVKVGEKKNLFIICPLSDKLTVMASRYRQEVLPKMKARSRSTSKHYHVGNPQNQRELNICI